MKTENIDTPGAAPVAKKTRKPRQTAAQKRAAAARALFAAGTIKPAVRANRFDISRLKRTPIYLELIPTAEPLERPLFRSITLEDRITVYLVVRQERAILDVGSLTRILIDHGFGPETIGKLHGGTVCIDHGRRYRVDRDPNPSRPWQKYNITEKEKISEKEARYGVTTARVFEQVDELAAVGKQKDNANGWMLLGNCIITVLSIKDDTTDPFMLNKTAETGMIGAEIQAKLRVAVVRAGHEANDMLRLSELLTKNGFSESDRERLFLTTIRRFGEGSEIQR